jgi:hypothetical protein
MAEALKTYACADVCFTACNTGVLGPVAAIGVAHAEQKNPRCGQSHLFPTAIWCRSHVAAIMIGGGGDAI